MLNSKYHRKVQKDFSDPNTEMEMEFVMMQNNLMKSANGAIALHARVNKL